MSDYATRRTPDYSPLVVHFTKAKPMMKPDALDEAEPLYAHRESSGYEKLVSILESGTIHASPMPTFPSNPRVVCFTECVWDGLVDLSTAYSPYGLVFSKRLIFERGGGPALYVRGDHMRDHGHEIPDELKPLVAPFDPTALMTPSVRLELDTRARVEAVRVASLRLQRHRIRHSQHRS